MIEDQSFGGVRPFCRDIGGLNWFKFRVRSRLRTTEPFLCLEIVARFKAVY